SLGTVSLSSSNRLPDNTGAMLVNPVRFPPRPGQDFNQLSRYRIRHPDKDDGDRSRSLLGSLNSIRRDPDKHVEFETDQLGRQARELLKLPLRMSVLNDNVLPLNMTEVA